jgi:DNA-binding MarR family transcriptional regulator
MRNLEEGFKFLGLTQKEMKIIVGLTIRPTTNVSDLAKTIRVARTTLLPLLTKLKKRGLVKEVLVGAHREWQLSEYGEIQAKLKDVLDIFEQKNTA